MREVMNFLYAIIGTFSLIYGVLILLKVIEPPAYYLVAALAYVCLANVLIDSLK